MQLLRAMDEIKSYPLNEHVSDIMHSTWIPARYKRGVGCPEGTDAYQRVKRGYVQT